TEIGCGRMPSFCRTAPGERLPSLERATRAAGYGARVILVVAATAEELAGAGGTATLACGVGPVEAAARTAAALEQERPAGLLHVGIAGGRTFSEPEVVIGSEAVYCDADDPRWIELRLPADPQLLARSRDLRRPGRRGARARERGRRARPQPLALRRGEGGAAACRAARAPGARA